MQVFANEKNKDPDCSLVLKFEATSKSLDGIRAYLEWAAGVMHDWAKWSDEECRQTRLPLTTGCVDFSTSCNLSIDRVGRTTFKKVVRDIGILVVLFFVAVGIGNVASLRSRLAQQKAHALEAFANFTNQSADAEFLKKAYSGLSVEVDKMERAGFARMVMQECARDFDDAGNKVVLRDGQHSLLYYECVEFRIRLESLEYDRDYLNWLSKERYPPSKQYRPEN
jgi:hypothetical protein